MAGTIRKTVNVLIQEDSGNTRTFTETAAIDRTGSGVDDRSHKIDSASHEAIIFPDIAAKGTIGYENVSDVIIHIGLEVGGTFYPFASLPPGDIGLFTGSSSALFAKADSGTDKELRLFVAES